MKRERVPEKKSQASAKSADHRREDFVRFRLRAEAPDFVAIGGARFSGAFRRAAQPFECTRGEWKVFIERTGFFEETNPQITQMTQIEEKGKTQKAESVKSEKSADANWEEK